MAEMTSAHGQGEKITRLTLFPPSGKRIVQTIQQYRYDGDVLEFTDTEGIKYETTLSFAIEHIWEGHRNAPFNEKFSS
jgi:hypothetical protein